MQKSITLTDQEAQELINMIDLAVRSSGINVAKNAVYLAEKIQTPFNSNNMETTNDKTPIGGGGGSPKTTTVADDDGEDKN